MKRFVTRHAEGDYWTQLAALGHSLQNVRNGEHFKATAFALNTLLLTNGIRHTRPNTPGTVGTKADLQAKLRLLVWGTLKPRVFTLR